MSDEYEALQQRVASGAVVLVARLNIAYTMGLWRMQRRPELVVLGLDAPLACWVLRNFITSGQHDRVMPLRAGSVFLNLVPECFPAVSLRAVPSKRRRHVPWLERLYGDEPYELLQVCWPDEEANLPTNRRCRRSVAACQDWPLWEKLYAGTLS